MFGALDNVLLIVLVLVAAYWYCLWQIATANFSEQLQRAQREFNREIAIVRSDQDLLKELLEELIFMPVNPPTTPRRQLKVGPSQRS
ncbi:hypothetical protein PENSPDRAFT_679414 [Peniophora sp. CONT]|nr:hypothetical protein PENSPDRAFT_679414 [Peniophora sp. CONT]